MRLTHAEELLQSLGIGQPSDIDLEAIAFYCGAEVRESPLIGCEAQIIGYNDEAIISINSTSTPERKKFSIGHELGHWRYHRGQSFICRSNDIGSMSSNYSATNPEVVADNYAADLLLPNYLFIPRSKQSPHSTFDAVLEIKEDFTTSITATALKYIQHSNEPTILICHENKGMRWFRRGKDVPNTLFPKRELDPESYAMDVLYKRSAQRTPNKIGADAWFDFSYADRYEVYEHSIATTTGQILTMISWRDDAMLEAMD